MHAVVVNLTDETRSAGSRAQRLADRAGEAYHALVTEIERYEGPQPVRRALATLMNEKDRQARYWARRAGSLDRELRAALASDEIADPAARQRARIALGIGGRRDRNLLSQHEAQMIEDYRGMDPAARQMVRTLFARLAETSSQ